MTTLATLSFLTAPASAQIQNERRPQVETPVWRNDPMYSTHNYKHPNKAAAAQRRDSATGVAVRRPSAGVGQVANYKMPATGRVPIGGITVPHRPNLNVAERNYKMPRPQVTTILITTDTTTRSDTSRTATDD